MGVGANQPLVEGPLDLMPFPKLPRTSWEAFILDSWNHVRLPHGLKGVCPYTGCASTGLLSSYRPCVLAEASPQAQSTRAVMALEGLDRVQWP